MNPERLQRNETKSRHPNWRRIYQEADPNSLPWHLDALDPDLAAALCGRELVEGTVLDVGTGTGSQARALSQLGFEVTATDVAPAAIQFASRRDPDSTYVVDDICHTQLTQTFDIVWDRGCFHVLSTELHSKYIFQIKKLLKPQGLLFLKCFSAVGADPGFGPERFTPKEIEAQFSSHFELEHIERTFFQGQTESAHEALFVVARRVR